MSDENENFVYGELILLGCNGSLPGQGDRGRRRSKFLVTRRSGPIGNGIKKARHYFVQSGAHQTKAVQDKNLHSISYTLARNEAVIVEYEPDHDTDLFQIGRSSEPNIDFIVLDTPCSTPQPGAHSNGSSNLSQGGSSSKADPLAHNHQHQHHHHNHSHHHSSHHGHSHHHSSSQSTQQQPQSTISRFACRILIERNPPHTARIFAAGFDSSRNIFLGEKATKWQSKSTGEFDAFTTNGILLMHPPPNVFDRNIDPSMEKDAQISPLKMNLKSDDFKWREVSVNGGIYDLRETRSSSEKGEWIESETNILRDGSLIDLCGATLLWRSRDAIHKPTKLDLEKMINAINASRPQCPVGLNTLFIPFGNMSRPPAISTTSLLSESGSFNEPYVYIKCGHVQGWHDWRRNGPKKKPRNEEPPPPSHLYHPLSIFLSSSNGHQNPSPVAGDAKSGPEPDDEERECPICLETGRVVKLNPGLEPSIYLDCDVNFSMCAFDPCGHMASARTVMYWSRVPIPHGTNAFNTVCPFCGVACKGSVRLIFQDSID